MADHTVAPGDGSPWQRPSLDTSVNQDRLEVPHLEITKIIVLQKSWPQQNAVHVEVQITSHLYQHLGTSIQTSDGNEVKYVLDEDSHDICESTPGNSTLGGQNSRQHLN